MSKTFESITKDQFEAYERTRKSGQYNMITERKGAMQYARLHPSVYDGVVLHYTELKKKHKNKGWDKKKEQK